MKKVNIKNLNSLSKKAYKAQNEMTSSCDKILEAISPFIDKEIVESSQVFIQEGDGICLGWYSQDRGGVNNTLIKNIITLINGTENILNEQDLLDISI